MRDRSKREKERYLVDDEVFEGDLSCSEVGTDCSEVLMNRFHSDLSGFPRQNLSQHIAGTCVSSN